MVSIHCEEICPVLISSFLQVVKIEVKQVGCSGFIVFPEILPVSRMIFRSEQNGIFTIPSYVPLRLLGVLLHRYQ